MIQANQQVVRTVVEEVLSQLGSRGSATTEVASSADGDWGVFSKVDDAVDAASVAYYGTMLDLALDAYDLDGDRLVFEADGSIRPVVMTNDGVAPQKAPKK